MISEISTPTHTETIVEPYYNPDHFVNWDLDAKNGLVNLLKALDGIGATRYLKMYSIKYVKEEGASPFSNTAKYEWKQIDYDSTSLSLEILCLEPEGALSFAYLNSTDSYKMLELPNVSVLMCSAEKLLTRYESNAVPLAEASEVINHSFYNYLPEKEMPKTMSDMERIIYFLLATSFVDIMINGTKQTLAPMPGASPYIYSVIKASAENDSSLVKTRLMTILAHHYKWSYETIKDMITAPMEWLTEFISEDLKLKTYDRRYDTSMRHIGRKPMMFFTNTMLYGKINLIRIEEEK